MVASDTSEGINHKQLGVYNKIRLRTWKLLTLYQGEALRNLEKVLQEYIVDITALQEIRWVGQDILERRGSNIR